MTNCNEIGIESSRLKSIFTKCYNLKAIDLRSVVDLIESVSACAGGSFALKTVNGQSLLGAGNVVVTAVVDGTETKVQQGTGITVIGNGSVANPYVVTNTITQANGSETKINQGSNVTIAGTGTIIDPYVINANVPAGSVQANSDWASISGVSQILNKPTIPSPQVNADWNAVSGIAQILNKPSNPDLQTVIAAGGYVESATGLASLDLSVTDASTYLDISNYNSNKTLEFRLSNGNIKSYLADAILDTHTSFTVSKNGTFLLDYRLGLNTTSIRGLTPIAETTLNFPAKAAGTYTIATIDDVSTPTLQEVLDTGAFASVDSGASYIDLFATFAGKKYSELIHTFTTNSAGWLIKDSQAQIGSHIAGFKSGILDATLGKVTISERDSATANTNVKFTTATAETTLNFPAKDTGVYILATTSDVDNYQAKADVTAASAANVGKLRYRSTANSSHVDMSMLTGVGIYSWVNIVQNNF